MSENESESDKFNYQVSNLQSRYHKGTIIDTVRSPRNASKTKMYLLFLIGSLSLVFISILSVQGIEFWGLSTYLEYWRNFENRDGAWATLILMGVINIFWIVVNMLIEFLANKREWIPPKSRPVGSLPATQSYQQKVPFNRTLYFEKKAEKYKAQISEDTKEFEEILSSPLLSPLAYFWKGIKAFYRSISRVGDYLYYWFVSCILIIDKLLYHGKNWTNDTLELMRYFLNPFHLLEEVIDIAITLLIRVFYPAILTPIIFFWPIRNNFVFEHIWQIFAYVLIIGGLRIGVEFFSIYIRYLRNVRYSD